LEAKVSLAHGSGGRLTRDLIQSLFLPRLGNDALAELSDAARVQLDGRPMLFTTDSFVVKPLEFPGGDIGKLAVCGTVNDLAVSGGRPLWLSCGLIIEEGLPIAVLERVADSIAAAARDAGVSVVCGDTKVVEAGGADGLFINTAGIGVPIAGYAPGPILHGDKVLVSGTIGDHEAAIFQARENLGRRLAIASDCASLHGLVAAMLATGVAVRVMRDPTRGGIGAALNELLAGSGCSVELEEDAIPLREEVRGMCELVGFDPMYLANEGKLVCFAAAEGAAALLAAMKAHALGAGAAAIGEVAADGRERVYLRSGFGGSRIVAMPSGVQLPRIC